MKVLLLLFLVGCATAFVVQNNNAVEQDYQEFMLELDLAEAEAKTELGKGLQKILDGLLEKINEEADKGKAVKQELIEKLMEVREKLEKLKMDIGHKARELIEKLKEKSDDFWDYILGKKQETYKESSMHQAMEFNLRDMFRKLKETILSKIDKEALKKRVEDIFGKGSEMADSLLEMINEKGDQYKQKLLDLVDRYLGKQESKRSIQDVWERIRDYFQKIHIELKEKYMKFGEWVKENVKNGIDKGKDKMENIRGIVKEFVEKAKDIKKDVAAEAKEFLEPYKKDLGNLWDQFIESANDIMKRKD